MPPGKPVEFYPLTHAFIARAMQETITHHLSRLAHQPPTTNSSLIFDRIALCRRTIARCDAADATPQAIWDDFSAQKAALGRRWAREMAGLGRSKLPDAEREREREREKREKGREEGSVRRALEVMEARGEREMEEGEVLEGTAAAATMAAGMGGGAGEQRSWERDVADLAAQYRRWDEFVRLRKLAAGGGERRGPKVVETIDGGF